MKMAKASEKDIDAAGDAMSVLNDISSGWYPARGEDCEGMPTFFNDDDPAHLRHFYNLMNATLDAAPGWPGRVIGGMCFVILYDKNEIVDPAADVLQLHPRFAATKAQRDQLAQALQPFVTHSSSEAYVTLRVKSADVERARQLLAELET